jgi:hypothetical protein
MLANGDSGITRRIFIHWLTRNSQRIIYGCFPACQDSWPYLQFFL